MAADEGDWRLVVFHGTPGNRYIFGRFMRTAPPGIEVVLPARPGFGKGHERAYCDFDDQMALIKPFLPGGAFGDKKIVTLGISYGGELALKAAMDFPEHVAGAVLVSALIDEPHNYALKLEELGHQDTIKDRIPNRWKKVRDEVTGRRSQIGPLLARLKDFESPVEVIHGDFDSIVPRSNSDNLYKQLSDASRGMLDIVPGGTHYLEGQYPRRLHQAVQRVIERAS